MNILSRLKAETKSDHDRLEAKLNILRPEMSLDEYRKILVAFFRFYSKFEEKIFSQAKYEILQDRSKIAWLAEDLKFLGVDTTKIEPLHWSDLPKLETSEEVWGAFYVMEGSTLGGQVLTKHFARKFDFDQSGLRFYSSYGTKTMARWRDFQNLLENSSHSLDQESVVKSAQSTFQRLEITLLS